MRPHFLHQVPERGAKQGARSAFRMPRMQVSRHKAHFFFLTNPVYNSTECARKASAEDYPRNFALIRLAERTLERQSKEQEEIARKKEAEQAAEQAS